MSSETARQSAFWPRADSQRSTQQSATINDSPHVAAPLREETVAKGQSGDKLIDKSTDESDGGVNHYILST
jgi:hypothetical protein